MTATFTKKDHYIIGIGFSAGGLEPLKEFFDHTPNDFVSYVIIQHMLPDFKSQMAEILARHSKLRVIEITDNITVEPDSVYVMPERKYVTISGGRLYLTNSDKQPNTAIDTFLDSLAIDYGDKSIAVILSGTGNDGTKGISAIKKAGGFVIVQNPEDAQYDGMPMSAIDSGNTSLVLLPKQMSDEIFKYIKQFTLLNQFTDSITEEDENALLKVLDIIKNNTPMDFSSYKRPTIVRRVVRRMIQYNMYAITDYIHFLEGNLLEIEALAKEFLISVTKFFRDKEAFALLNDKVIHHLVRNKLSADVIKIWVIGCATGEEVYSLAILLKEELIKQKKDLEIKIFATDIDKEALSIASRGIYPETISKDVSQERLDLFFTKEGSSYKINDNIRKMVIFARHDIIKQPPYAKVDLISCRNLFIYLDPILQKKILTTLHFCLNNTGYLFLGPSESLGDIRKYFSEISDTWKIYKNTIPARSIGNGDYTWSRYEVAHHISPNIPLQLSKNTVQNTLADNIIQALVKYSGYAGVCVDEDYKIIQPFGNFKKYLLPHMFNFNLLEMVPEELSIALGTCLRDAFMINKESAIKDIKYAENNSIRTVNIHVIPLLESNNQPKKSGIVLFSEENNEKPLINEQIFDKDKYKSRYIASLELSLKEIKRELQEAYEALQISNDNAQSHNEELISSNEEMQSTNEELQSVNEELQTVNIGYQEKIRELGEALDDLNNFFRSAINGQIYVDNNLIIRKFTPSAVQQINLIESDLGRSLSNISTNIKFHEMTEDIVRVIRDAIIYERQVQTKDGKWYQMSIIPYVRKQQDNKTDGAIITFYDITELKKAQEILIETNAVELRKKNDELMRINNDLDSFIYTASHDLKSPISNIEGLVYEMMEHQCYRDDEVKFFVDMMDMSVKKFKHTIDELTDISKIQNSIAEDIENQNIVEIIEEVKFSIKDLIDKNKVHIDTSIEDNLIIRFSKKNFRSILYNLMSNAIKYRSPKRKPEIVLKAAQQNDYIKISVSDNGLGISDTNKEKMFTMFKRFHDHVEGTGIGLYIVKKMLENAGGKIEVESELDKGSVFNVYFKSPVHDP